MSNPQVGIFALGTASHSYLEFDLLPGADARELAAKASSLREPRTTVGGVNLVVGFRPELWRAWAPGDAPADLEGFNADIVGAGGFVMPATQHDVVIWLSGMEYDVIFNTAKAVVGALAPVASVADETVSWPYERDRDLTGFIDGTENPDLIDAAEIALFPDGRPGAGGTVLLLQKWPHDRLAWEALSDEQQEQVMGRTKRDSIELDDKPVHSHVSSTDQDRFGHIFRRNMPYGSVTDHGTMFVGFSSQQRRLSAMLESMAGVLDGERDALTRYTHPLTGAYYVIPSANSLRR
jgi:putative iron-dependent peroxidase